MRQLVTQQATLTTSPAHQPSHLLSDQPTELILDLTHQMSLLMNQWTNCCACSLIKHQKPLLQGLGFLLLLKTIGICSSGSHAGLKWMIFSSSLGKVSEPKIDVVTKVGGNGQKWWHWARIVFFLPALLRLVRNGGVETRQ